MCEQPNLHPGHPFPELTPRERVFLALRGQPTGRPAWGELVLEDGLIAEFLGVPAVDHAARREFVNRLGLDLVCLSVSQGTVGWRELAQWGADGDRFVLAMVNGGFGQGIDARGFEPFLLEVARQNPELHGYFRRSNRRCLESAVKALDLGADGILLADDIAHGHGLLAPPEFFRDFYLSALGDFLGEMKRRGAPVFFHSDGELGEMLPDLAAWGFSGVAGLERAAGMDLARARRAVGPRLCLWGNLDPAWLTGELDQAELSRRVEQILRAADSGPFIFGTSSGLYTGMKLRTLSWLSLALRG